MVNIASTNFVFRTALNKAKHTSFRELSFELSSCAAKTAANENNLYV